MDAAKWWDLYGYKAPTLQSLAIKVLSQTTSASACERNWSAYNNILSKKRNRLGDDRCKDLVYVFMNRKLFHSKRRRIDPIKWQERCEIEDVDDDDSDSDSNELVDLNFAPHIIGND